MPPPASSRNRATAALMPSSDVPDMRPTMTSASGRAVPGQTSGDTGGEESKTGKVTGARSGAGNGATNGYGDASGNNLRITPPASSSFRSASAFGSDNFRMTIASLTDPPAASNVARASSRGMPHTTATM